MSGFSNPIIGGGGTLVYPAIRSPNYVTGISGWSINKSGFAEFQNVIVRGTFSGINQFYGVTASGDNTGAADSAALKTAFLTSDMVLLAPGTYYLDQPLAGLTSPGQVLAGAGYSTIIQDGSLWSGSALFEPSASNVTISGIQASLTAASLVDFGNANIDYFLMSGVFATAGASAPDMLTGFNLHRSLIENCILTQDNPGASILTMGASGSGLSTTTFRACRFIASCAAGSVSASGNRTVPAINLQVPVNKNLDVLAFDGCWFNNAMNGTNLDNGEYFVSIACTEGGANHDEDRLFFENCSCNQVIGGAVQLQSIVGAVFNRFSVGNVFSVTTPFGAKKTAASFINIGTFAGGQHSQAITITDYEREGTANLTSGSNPSDVQISSDTVQVYMRNPHVPDSGGGIQIDTGGCTDFDLVCANSNLVFVTVPGTGSVNSNGVLTLYKATGGVSYSVSGGNGQLTTAAGLAQNISGSFTSQTDVSAITTVGPLSMGHRSIPANDVVTGSRYHITAWGTYTTGGSAPTGATFSVYWGGIAGTLINSVSPPSVAGSQSGQIWSLEADVWWSAAGTAWVRIALDWSASGGPSRVVTAAAAAGLITSSAENLTLAFGWGSVPGGQSLAILPVWVSRLA